MLIPIAAAHVEFEGRSTYFSKWADELANDWI